MPAHHDVRAANVDLKRLGAVLAVAYERDLHDFAELLLLEKLGPRTLQSLALVAEVVHGAPSRFTDPARFSFAHGGKDRHPFPVPLKTYDESLNFLRSALDRAKVGIRNGSGNERVSDREKLEGFRRLEAFARGVERQMQPEADFAASLPTKMQFLVRLADGQCSTTNRAGYGKAIQNSDHCFEALVVTQTVGLRAP